jgi:excisionase family DNA binding protein
MGANSNMPTSEKIAVLTPDEVATRWRIKYATVLAMISRGDLPAFKAGKQYRIPLDVVEDMERTNQIPKENK